MVPHAIGLVDLDTCVGGQVQVAGVVNRHPVAATARGGHEYRGWLQRTIEPDGNLRTNPSSVSSTYRVFWSGERAKQSITCQRNSGLPIPQLMLQSAHRPTDAIHIAAEVR